MEKELKSMDYLREYNKRVMHYEDLGMTRSDAQGVVDAEISQGINIVEKKPPIIPQETIDKYKYKKYKVPAVVSAMDTMFYIIAKLELEKIKLRESLKGVVDDYQERHKMFGVDSMKLNLIKVMNSAVKAITETEDTE